MPRHPVHTLLAQAAYACREATEEELAELDLAADDRALVRRAAREAAFLHAGGGPAPAARPPPLARDHRRAPEQQRDLRYLHQPDNLGGLGPAELAARVPR